MGRGDKVEVSTVLASDTLDIFHKVFLTFMEPFEIKPLPEIICKNSYILENYVK